MTNATPRLKWAEPRADHSRDDPQGSQELGPAAQVTSPCAQTPPRENALPLCWGHGTSLGTHAHQRPTSTRPPAICTARGPCLHVSEQHVSGSSILPARGITREHGLVSPNEVGAPGESEGGSHVRVRPQMLDEGPMPRGWLAAARRAGVRMRWPWWLQWVVFSSPRPVLPATASGPPAWGSAGSLWEHISSAPPGGGPRQVRPS